MELAPALASIVLGVAIAAPVGPVNLVLRPAHPRDGLAAWACIRDWSGIRRRSVRRGRRKRDPPPSCSHLGAFGGASAGGRPRPRCDRGGDSALACAQPLSHPGGVLRSAGTRLGLRFDLSAHSFESRSTLRSRRRVCRTRAQRAAHLGPRTGGGCPHRLGAMVPCPREHDRVGVPAGGNAVASPREPHCRRRSFSFWCREPRNSLASRVLARVVSSDCARRRPACLIRASR